PRIPRLPRLATGSASVAPQAVNPSADSGSSLTNRLIDAAEAGAPAEMTRRKVASGGEHGRGKPGRSPWGVRAAGFTPAVPHSPILRSTPGEPNRLFTPNCRIGALAFPGPVRPG